ncbi:uncharacterized protein DUF4376 [Pseudomonas baetica]|uniref:Uncharacterized protein DUF4376 n=1 Tax=Pseudomonas baetica TaxID=674054 RepID=A0ABX4Q403_9PSED|nr:DUF4376 domain-containing protein [Pseudomonas baetica]PKA71472.1 uncharacterized protein DUF4376 [Pseudomonas baetica]
MSTYVRIYADMVVEQIETEGDISTLYPPTLVWVCVDHLDPRPQQGWAAKEHDGDWLFSPQPSMTVTPETLATAVAAERFLREAGGVIVDGFTIETTRDSQTLIAGMGLSAIVDPEYRCNFKTANGFVEIDATRILEIAKAVRTHVQACFDRERDLLLAIDLGNYRPEMLTEGWPAVPPASEPGL